MRHKILFVLLILLLILGGCKKKSSGALRDEAESEEVFDREMEKGDIEVSKKKESADDFRVTDSDEELDGAPQSEDKKSGKGDEDEGFDFESARHIATSDEFKTRTPELLARIKSSDLEPLPLMSQDISVIATGSRIRVVYDLVFKNPSDQQLSGKLMIELPDGASPSYLGMFQGAGPNDRSVKNWLNPEPPSLSTLLDRELKLPASWTNEKDSFDFGEFRPARVVEAVKGRQIYEQVTRQRIDPALTEWAGGGKFSTRIFPIAPKGYKRVVFAYDQPVKAYGKNILLPLPFPTDNDAEKRITIYAATNAFINPQVIGKNEEIKRVNTGFGLRWLHNPGKKRNGGGLSFKAELPNPEVRYLVGRDDEISGKLVHLYYRPELPAKSGSDSTGKALFIVDTSFSTKDKLYTTSGKMLRALLENDSSISEFAILGFDVATREVTDGFIENSRAGREEALKRLEQIRLEGATNLSSVLETINFDSRLRESDTIFLLSDGNITWGVDNIQTLRERFSSILTKRWICYSFGMGSVNSALFAELTKGGGRVVQVAPGQDLSKAALAHRSSGFKLDKIESREEIVISGDPLYLYEGQVLEMAVLMKENRDELKFKLTIEGVEREVAIPLEENTLLSHLGGRAWAELYVAKLLGLYDERADQAAIAISQRFTLTNRETSFIILETDEEYELYSIKPDDLEIKKIVKLIEKEESGQDYGAPDSSGLDKSALKVIAELKEYKEGKAWNLKVSRTKIGRSFEVYEKVAKKRRNDYPETLYKDALNLYKKGEFAQALRVLSTIMELNYQDDKAARLTGFVLMEWGMYEEAEQIFAAVRRRRPFEPQGYILEALALTAQRRLGEAALRYEIVLQKEFSRFGTYNKSLARTLYRELLIEVERKNSSKVLKRRINEISDLDTAYNTNGRLVLFWNLDDTDVDLHVREDKKTEVNYQNKESRTGGRLYWDNTEGLGPEIYEHPYISDDGFDVMVNYFGSSSVEGAAPAATLVTAFNFTQPGQAPWVAWYTKVLDSSTKGDKIMIMPKWIIER